MKATPAGRIQSYRREAGFTLLEVIIALTLMFILAVALSGSISFGNRVWERTDRITRSSGDMISAYQFLEATFGSVVTSPGTSEDPSFTGSSQEVSLRTDGFTEIGLPGPRLLQLRLVADRIEVRLPIEEGAAPGPQFSDRDFVLMSDVRSWAIAYSGSGPDHRSTGWVDQWPGNLPPPALIRLTMTNADLEERIWFFRLPQLQ